MNPGQFRSFSKYRGAIWLSYGKASIFQVTRELGLCVLVGILSVEVSSPDNCAFLFVLLARLGALLLKRTPTIDGGLYHASNEHTTGLVVISCLEL